MTKRARLTSCLIALVLCLAGLSMPAASAVSATPAKPGTEAPVKAKLHAKLLDTKVTVNAKARIHGKLDLDLRSATAREPIVVQRLVGGVWVDLLSANCRPSLTFQLSVSFSISAEYTLRLYHPLTAVSSNTLALTVF